MKGRELKIIYFKNGALKAKVKFALKTINFLKSFLSSFYFKRPQYYKFEKFLLILKIYKISRHQARILKFIIFIKKRKIINYTISTY